MLYSHHTKVANSHSVIRQPSNLTVSFPVPLSVGLERLHTTIDLQTLYNAC
jgi:hypothetical protein